jgi:hypothetical protein
LAYAIRNSPQFGFNRLVVYSVRVDRYAIGLEILPIVEHCNNAIGLNVDPCRYCLFGFSFWSLAHITLSVWESIRLVAA